MRQFLNFPQGEGQYKDLKINVAGLASSAFTLAGSSIVSIPLLANYNCVIELQVSGADQSDARYQAIVDNINSGLVANPGGVSVDVLGPINLAEVKEFV